MALYHNFQKLWQCLTSKLLVFLVLRFLLMSSHRPVVRFLPRGPDETGCEDRWGILSQSQVPDTTGVSVLSEFFLHTQWLNLFLSHRVSTVFSVCLSLDILCWDADWFPQRVRDLAQRSNRQLLRGVWAQVCSMQWWLIATWVTQCSFVQDYVLKITVQLVTPGV